ncbi:MAG: DUF6873 family GME fold protein [Bacteroidota bacterium]
MWIIIDKRIADASKKVLSSLGNLLELESSGIVYDAISGHPDIFSCQADDHLIMAPNTPESFVAQLEKSKIGFEFGTRPLGMKYPHTAHYNAVVTEQLLIHNLDITDPKLLDLCKSKQKIQVNQAYTRCNLMALDYKIFITSDKGIEKALVDLNFNVFYVEPDKIELSGFAHGFFGGCCGVLDKKILLNGSLHGIRNKDSLQLFAEQAGFSFVELNNGPLCDAGSIFFVAR